jgi:hypothetical protein
MRARLRKLLEKWRHERLARKVVRRGIAAAGGAGGADEHAAGRPTEAPPGHDKTT